MARNETETIAVSTDPIESAKALSDIDSPYDVISKQVDAAKSVAVLKSGGGVTSDIVKILSGGAVTEKSPFDIASEKVEVELAGRKRARVELTSEIIKSLDVDQLNMTPYDIARQKALETLQGATIGNRLKRAAAPMVGVAGKTLQSVLETLNTAEYSSVKTLRSSVGLPELKNFTDNTYTNFLIEGGQPDNLTTHVLGLLMSIFADPITYVGVGPAKIGLRLMGGIGFTKVGRKWTNEIIRDVSEREIREVTEKFGRELTNSEINTVIRKNKEDVELQVLKKFGAIDKEISRLRVSPEVELLPESAVQRGGARAMAFGREYQIPGFHGADIKLFGHTVLPGAWSVQNLLKTGHDKFIKSLHIYEADRAAGAVNASKFADNPKNFQLIADNPGILDEIRNGGKAEPKTAWELTTGIRDKVYHPLTSLVRNTFYPGFRIDKDLVDIFKKSGAHTEEVYYSPSMQGLDAVRRDSAYIVAQSEMADEIIAKNAERYHNHFQGLFGTMTQAQRSEFMRTALDESYKLKEMGITKLQAKTRMAAGALKVKTPTGDVVVQEALDRMYAQGKYKGRKPVQDIIAQFSKLSEDEKIPLWIPGIQNKLKYTDIRVGSPFSESQRLFLQERSGGLENVKSLKHDPVDALTYRMTEIAAANMQDKIYNNIVKLKLGDVRHFDSIDEAKRAGYVAFKKPVRMIEKAIRTRKEVTKEQLYIKREVASAYESLIDTGGFVGREPEGVRQTIDFLNGTTGLLKHHLTLAHPAYHFVNITGNITNNAFSIGLHAINPSVNIRAAIAVHTGRRAATGTLEEKIAAASNEFVTNSSPQRVYINEIGERLTQDNWIKEGKQHGILEDTFTNLDLSGGKLDADGKTIWQNILYKTINPLSKDAAFFPYARKFAGFADQQARMTNFIAHRMKGLDAKTAAQAVNDAHYDFRNLTRIEQRYLNNLLIPFYSWGKQNFIAQLRRSWARPGYAAGWFDALKSFSPTQEEWDRMPIARQNRMAFRFGENFYFFNGFPISDFLQIMNVDEFEPMLRINPLIRMSIELGATGRDTKTDKRLDEYRQAGDFAWAYKISKDPKSSESAKMFGSFFVGLFGIKHLGDGRFVMNPTWRHIIDNTFTSRYVSTMRLLSGQQRTGLEIAMSALLGITKIPKDMERAAGIRSRDAIEEITKASNRHGGPDIYYGKAKGESFEAERLNEYFEEIKEAKEILDTAEIRRIKTRALKQIKK